MRVYLNVGYNYTVHLCRLLQKNLDRPRGFVCSLRGCLTACVSCSVGPFSPCDFGECRSNYAGNIRFLLPCRPEIFGKRANKHIPITSNSSWSRCVCACLLPCPTPTNKDQIVAVRIVKVAGVVEVPKLSVGSNLGFTAGLGLGFNLCLLSSLCWRGSAETEVQRISSLLWCGSTKMIAF